jgi:hypothetical protein
MQHEEQLQICINSIHMGIEIDSSNAQGSRLKYVLIQYIWALDEMIHPMRKAEQLCVRIHVHLKPPPYL